MRTHQPDAINKNPSAEYQIRLGKKIGLVLRILLDEMYTGLKEYLQTMGWDVLTVQDVKLKGASDKKIAEYAAKSSLLLVTQDEKHADLASLRRVPCVLISKVMLTRMIDAELRKNPDLKHGGKEE